MEMGMAMPITDTEYFNITIAKTPEVKAEKEYTIKKGDSLWGIAKNALGKNAKNGEILDYTYKIAKLNKLKSQKEMRSLKINDKIYLPEKVNDKDAKTEEQTESAKTKPSTKEEPATKPEKAKVQKQNNTVNPQVPEYLKAKKEEYTLPKINFEKTNFVSNWKPKQEEVKIPFAANPPHQTGKAVQTKQTAPVKPIQKQTPVQKAKTPQKPKQNFELGFEDIKNSIVNTDKKFLYLDCGYKGERTGVYTVYKIDEKETYKKKQLATFTMDNKGNLREISFNGRKNLIPTRYDYTAHKYGKITQSDEFGLTIRNLGNINQGEYNQMENVLKGLVSDISRNHKDIYW